MRKLELAFLLGLIFTVVTSSVVSFAQECANVRSDVLRIHILANSDREQDQALKLKVRDQILAQCSDVFEDSQTKEAAKVIAKESVDKIAAVAQEEIYKNGYDYTCTVQVVNMYFSTREYEEFTMPAGHYDAVRVTIGEGKGQNWWCVMFPPLCVPAATPQEGLSLLSDEEKALVNKTPVFEPRFALVEWWEGMKEKNN